MQSFRVLARLKACLKTRRATDLVALPFLNCGYGATTVSCAFGSLTSLVTGALLPCCNVAVMLDVPSPELTARPGNFVLITATATFEDFHET
jgi:hypothetical protein